MRRPGARIAQAWQLQKERKSQSIFKNKWRSQSLQRGGGGKTHPSLKSSFWPKSLFKIQVPLKLQDQDSSFAGAPTPFWIPPQDFPPLLVECLYLKVSESSCKFSTNILQNFPFFPLAGSSVGSALMKRILPEQHYLQKGHSAEKKAKKVKLTIITHVHEYLPVL